MKWYISIANKHKNIKVSKRKVTTVVSKILGEVVRRGLPQQYNHISILFVNDRTIHKLNREYRKKDKPTDVLSFPQVSNNKETIISPSLGDLVISLDTTKMQAKEYGVTFWNELTRLLVHGTLHLAGYDHEKVSPKVAQKMRRTERSIMKFLCN